MDASEFARSLSKFIEVMSRYLSDVVAPDEATVRNRRRVKPWGRAKTEAQEALRNAAAALWPVSAERRPGRDSDPEPVRCRLDAATQMLTAGRDLLQTHLTTRPDGTWRAQSEWAPVVTSAPVARALMLELGRWAGQVAPEADHLAMSPLPDRPKADNARLALDIACQWLQVVHSAVQSAQRNDPVSAMETRLLNSIPVNALPERRRPDGRETVADLCDGTTGSAERVRHLARIAVREAVWSPGLSADSLREAAACATAISHHCSVVLHTLADSAVQHGSPEVSAALLEASAASAHARGTWLQTARAWENITTETGGLFSPASAEVADLALWTGRLAFADPGWTLAQGPIQPVRSPESLAPEPGDVPAAVAAVHQASDTLTQLASADQAQANLAARATWFRSPTRSLPEWIDNPHPYGRTPSDWVSKLFGAYRDAGAASAQATTAIAAIAEAVRAPSRTLAAARAAVQASRSSIRPPLTEPASCSRHPDTPGHFERTLSELGITSPDLLTRASVIDHAGDQLVLEAAQAAQRLHWHSASRDLAMPLSTAELVSRTRVTAVQRTAIARSPESPENPRPNCSGNNARPFTVSEVPGA